MLRRHVVHRQHLRLQRLLPPERQELAHQGRPAPGAGADLGQVVQHLDRQFRPRRRGLRRAEHGRQQIVEIMRDAARELPHRLHFLRLGELRLQPALGREIRQPQQRAADRRRPASRSGSGARRRR